MQVTSCPTSRHARDELAASFFKSVHTYLVLFRKQNQYNVAPTRTCHMVLWNANTKQATQHYKQQQDSDPNFVGALRYQSDLV